MAIKVFGKIGNQDIHRLHHMCLPFFLNLESKAENFQLANDFTAVQQVAGKSV